MDTITEFTIRHDAHGWRAVHVATGSVVLTEDLRSRFATREQAEAAARDFPADAHAAS